MAIEWLSKGWREAEGDRLLSGRTKQNKTEQNDAKLRAIAELAIDDLSNGSQAIQQPIKQQ